MRGASTVAVETKSSVRRTLVSATVGTTIEWYDFYIYATCAALVFPTVFFKDSDPQLAVLASFGTYTVGFLARPLGGVIFGHMGDRIGRKAALISTLLIMGFGTLAIGMLPTYEQIGIWAPILLVVLRIVQGIGVGGEWGGAVLIAMEAAPKEKRGFYAAWPGFGVPVALLISTGVISFVSAVTGDDFVGSGPFAGWRWPFYVSVLLILVGFYMRAKVDESAAFKKTKAMGAVAKQPVIEVIRKNWREILTIIFLRAGENAPYYVFASFVLVYGTTVLGFSREFILNCVLGASAIAMFTVPFFGWLSDRIGRRRTYVIGTMLQLLFIFPYFGLLNTGHPVVVAVTVVLSLVPWTMQYGPQPALIAESFPAGLRYSGASLGYQFSSPLWGGLAPLIAVALLPVSIWWIAAYMAALCIVTLVASRTIRDNTGDVDEVVLADDIKMATPTSR
ncbi:MFS transporter [Arthrobacter sp. AB6]|uniref:MFS transporter n=1 Tax=Arthrobacter sp. AB6 TaxID=2962570 RepID=UPI0028820333|nr:MFS transporter [Arthrobacter sp. AB6]MDT0196468.1 MFS transporter [Arthrobacter sp. AB6]